MNRDYEGQTSLGKWVADRLRQKGEYRDLEEQVEIAYATQALEESLASRSAS